jgi:predicted ferric reductase
MLSVHLLSIIPLTVGLFLLDMSLMSESWVVQAIAWTLIAYGLTVHVNTVYLIRKANQKDRSSRYAG